MTGEVAIAGLGLVTAFGPGAQRYWRELCAGRSALRPATRPGYGVVGQVPVDDPAAPDPDEPRKLRYAETALREALAGAGLSAVPPDAVVVAASQAPPAPERADRPAGMREFTGPDLTARLPPTVPVWYVSHACASAAFGLLLARDLVRSGHTGTAVVLGAHVLNEYEHRSMEVVKALSPEPARPFDPARAGISLGEGGGAVVLRPATGAAGEIVVAGGATRVAGALPAAAATADLAGCMRAALADADAAPPAGAGEPARPDYVHAHATGTAQGDDVELDALGEVLADLGPAGVPVSSHKGAVGHLLHSSFFPALVAASAALRTGTAPPTVGLGRSRRAGPAWLPATTAPLAGRRLAMVNSFGFGGSTASVLLRHRTRGV
ncbi:3-oxoacyl-ACP synthase [Micromonospora fluostatini]|uniref:3-oxoacyl-ACP synthase n=1 Tax=Micromonospora fluostatini TaxID=1629071 RepID=A0ABY2DJX1_9ACTN|nr:3-oxoacyl-ACP synthase [Micromonospora fluostatini]